MEIKKKGRPVKTENRRDARFQIRLNEEDKKEIRKIAIDMDMSTSDFFVHAAKKLIKEMKEDE